MILDRTTRRVFHEDPWLASVPTHVIKTGADWVELADTIAYPEGGGQEADHGVIRAACGGILRFTDARKMYGVPCNLPGYPPVQVGGVIWHLVTPADQPKIASLMPGEPVTVAIDVARRAALTLSHTASHLLYMGVLAHRPDAIEQVIGCHIRTDGARFDFAVEERFTPEQIECISATANELVRADHVVRTTADPVVPDARQWHCAGTTIGCGGTHLTRTGPIGPMTVRRKRLGAGKERLICEFPSAGLEIERYKVLP